MPGGVNSPVRAFKSVGGEPFFVAARRRRLPVRRRRQPLHRLRRLVGPDDRRPRPSRRARRGRSRTARDGLSFGAPNALEVTMAETIARLVPSCEMVRMVNSGTEATLSAIRLARGATGRARIVKFEGCYHGHGDSFLVKAGTGALTLRRADLARRAEGARRPHADPAVQRLRCGHRAVRRSRRRHRRPDHRAGRRQRELPACRARATCSTCARCARGTARC